MWRWVCALALLCAALLNAETFKRAEMSAVPFVLGSRYGRSPQRVMSARNDSRYGKRSEGAAGARGLRWRPLARCHCNPYADPAPVSAPASASAHEPRRALYKRRPEVADSVPAQD